MEDFDRLKLQKDRLLETGMMKRYELRSPEPSWEYGAYENVGGEWVRYEDVQRLDDECNALVKKLGQARMERDNERRCREAARRESEKLSRYISDLRTEVAIRQETIKQMAVERRALECKIEELAAALFSCQETIKELQK